MDSILKTNDPVERLFSRINYEKQTRVSSGDFKLSNMFQFLARLGNPHLACPVIHVAGTKGKGSVCAFIGSILKQAGYRVGIYTSPHLERINQRIHFDGCEIDDGELKDVLKKLEPTINKMDLESQTNGTNPLTFFEVITATGFQYFADKGADAVILEVGMGGRLDSTNVCQPQVCVITNISLDHTRQLGTTTDKIAAEKAGILKSGVPAICGVTDELPRQVIHQIASNVGSRIYQLNQDFYVESSDSEFLYRSEIRNEGFQTGGLRSAMAGEHQRINAGLAIAASELLTEQGWQLNEDHIKAGVEQAQLPGRCEVISGCPTFVLDMAHNEASTAMLAKTLQKDLPCFRQAESRVMVFAASREKNVEAMLRPLLPLFDEVWITKYTENPRGRCANEIFEIASSQNDSPDKKLKIVDSPRAALELTKENSCPNRVVCITGSAFLVAELRPFLTVKTEN